MPEMKPYDAAIVSTACGVCESDVLRGIIQDAIKQEEDEILKERLNEIEQIDSKKWTYRPDAQKRKKEKLPKKLRNGWK